jgi:hypothetical protein
MAAAIIAEMRCAPLPNNRLKNLGANNVAAAQLGASLPDGFNWNCRSDGAYKRADHQRLCNIGPFIARAQGCKETPIHLKN